MKFGGTSVGNPERLQNVARRIVAAKEEGGRVVAVLSAMGDTTDELVDLAHQISAAAEAARDGHADLRRRAHLVRARGDGDRGSRPRGDLADRLAGRHRHRHDAHEGEDRRGARAAHPRSARRGEDRPRRRLPGRLDRRRRSRRSAAAAPTRPRSRSPRALGADSCEIFTDVEGVYTADPRLVPGAQKLPVVTYEEMLEMSASGAKVMALRSVEFARNHGVRLHVRSTFSGRAGHLDSRGGRAVAGEGDHLGCHARHLGGEADGLRRARPARRRRARLPRARRQRREHRHDRPERLRAGPDRHLVHRAEGRPRASRSRSSRPPARTSARPASRRTPTSPRSR